MTKWLLIWTVPGAVIQWLGGHRQIGSLFATGLLAGSAVKRNPENEAALSVLGTGALAGSALYRFFTARLGLVKRD